MGDAVDNVFRLPPVELGEHTPKTVFVFGPGPGTDYLLGDERHRARLEDVLSFQHHFCVALDDAVAAVRQYHPRYHFITHECQESTPEGCQQWFVETAIVPTILNTLWDQASAEEFCMVGFDGVRQDGIPQQIRERVSWFHHKTGNTDPSVQIVYPGFINGGKVF